MSDLSPDEAANRIGKALERIKQDLPSAANLVAAFSALLIESARLKAGASVQAPAVSIDPERSRQGVPLLDRTAFSVSPEQVKTAAESLIPPMAQGLPKVADDLMAVKEALLTGSIRPEIAADLIAGRHDSIEKAARAANVPPEVLEFAVGWIIKPFVEKQAELIGPLPEDLPWFKGYCPICGSWPALSLLREREGRRSLRCSFCAHEWRFMRTKCPFCENEHQEALELVYSEDRPFERAEECHACKKYILGLDLRERDNVVVEVASIGLVYLDVLAQEQGFEPGAVTEWNYLAES